MKTSPCSKIEVFIFNAYLILCCALPTQGFALTIRNFSNETNDRFTNNNSYIGTGYDFTGVGRDPLFPGRRSWATLISPNVIVTANHFKARGQVRFYLGNDRSDGFVDMAIRGQKLRIPGTDIYLQELAQDVPSEVLVYDYVKTPLTNLSFGASGLAGDLIFMTGIHPTNAGNLLDMTVGTNRIDGYFDNASSPLGNQLDYLVAQNNPATDASATFHESRGQVGDSGGPAFVMQNGELKLLGFNSEITASSTLISYLGNESALIDQFIEDVRIAADIPIPSNLPEPTMSTLVMFMGSKLIFFRRRQKTLHRTFAKQETRLQN